MTKLVSLLFLTIVCASCAAQSIPFPFSDTGWELQTKGLLPEKWHTVGQVSLYKTTLDEIEQFYGKGLRFRADDKNYSPYLQCYLVKNDHVIVFQSGPLGGWSIVTGILIARKSAYGGAGCGGRINFDVPFGVAELRIGDIEGEVYNLLGQPSLKTDSLLAYRYEQQGGSKIKGLSDKSIYVTSGIEVGLNKGEVIWVRVYWQEST